MPKYQCEVCEIELDGDYEVCEPCFEYDYDYYTSHDGDSW